MRSTLKINFPDVADLQAALVVSVHHRFRDNVIAAERDRDQAIDEAKRLGEFVEAFRAGFRPGQSTADLEQAIARRSALELVQPALERAVNEAKSALDAAELDAKQRVLAEAMKHRDAIQLGLSELAAVLDRTKDLETVLDQAVKGLELPGVEEVPAIVWPRPRVDDFRLLNYPDRSVLSQTAWTA
jgi:hypothetical protein